jgi:hypothetical protein
MPDAPFNLTTFTESSVVSAPVAEFQGLWIHDPDNAQLSSHQFLYGRDLRSYSMEFGGTDMVFAGRKFKVVEFGEHQEDVFSCGVKIPHGPDYYTERRELREFAAMKETLCVRDNRGHVIFGAIKSLSEEHASDGSDFSFEVERVNRSESFID